MKSYQQDLFDRRRKRRNPVVVPPEAKEQEALFDWARLAVGKYPELALLHAIPNGGWRHKATAVALKRQGVKAGVPDICLPVARGRHHGLYVELKRTVGGVESDAQCGWIEALSEQGYLAVVCAGCEEAMRTIEAYLNEEAVETETEAKRA